jgi:hypothetical protein
LKSQDPYKQGLISMVEGYGNYFSQHSEAFLLQIGKFQSIRNTLTAIYGLMVARKLCDPIESVSDKEKRELWAEAKRISSNQERTFLIEVVKAIHALGSFFALEGQEIEL